MECGQTPRSSIIDTPGDCLPSPQNFPVETIPTLPTMGIQMPTHLDFLALADWVKSSHLTPNGPIRSSLPRIWNSNRFLALGGHLLPCVEKERKLKHGEEKNETSTWTIRSPQRERGRKQMVFDSLTLPASPLSYGKAALPTFGFLLFLWLLFI